MKGEKKRKSGEGEDVVVDDGFDDEMKWTERTPIRLGDGGEERGESIVENNEYR